MVKAKKDMLSRKFYRSLKKHPVLKNPIVLVYLVSFIIIAAGYIIYLIYKESI